MESEDDIVITGMAGRFPESDNVEEFARQLYAGIDMVTDDDRRWPRGLHGVRMPGGKIKNLSHFDATYFNVSGKQANVMDPQLRMMLEVVHETIVDAGICPTEMRSSNTAVLTCTSFGDAKDFWTSDFDKITGYEYTGGLPSMFSSRITYAYDLHGPSHNIDAGCASSVTAVAEAVTLIQSGKCDAAIVAGSHLCLSANCTCALDRLKVLSPAMRCQTFDANARGFVRSEAVVAILLQKRSTARRLYVTIRAIGMGSEGYKPEGINYPNHNMQICLSKNILDSAFLNPLDVSYVEAHGTGTNVGDIQEVTSILEIFCKERKTPLLMGSVKSNIGHTEPVAGLCSIVKVILAMESGVIPGNLNYNIPNPKLPALTDGRIKVVDQNTPFNGGLVVINCYGFGGSNSVAVLESSNKSRPPNTKYSFPRLVTASGCTKAAVCKLLTLAQNHEDKSELHALFDAVHAQTIHGHTHRGYVLLGRQYLSEVSDKIDRPERPEIYFIFTGSETLWTGIDNTLLEIPVLRKSIERSAAIVKPHGIDLNNILFEKKMNIDVLCATVALVSLHVALVDLLRELDIHADRFLGCSFGEIGCGYADGILTIEQAILCGYWCGVAFMNTQSISESAPIIRKKLLQIIPNPKKRSNRWISSISKNKWKSENGIMCSAEYLAKTITSSSVMFTEVIQNVSERAIVAELSHQSELTTAAVGATTTIIPLVNGTNDLCQNILIAIGRLYNAGVQPKLSHLYPSVQWPVSKGTPGLSSSVSWNHSMEWKVPCFGKLPQIGKTVIKCDLSKEKDAFIAGHKIDGKIFYPIAGFLVVVWRTLAKMCNKKPESTPVIIENACFIKSDTLSYEIPLQCEVTVYKRTGLFEISMRDDLIATGSVRLANTDISVESLLLQVPDKITMKQSLSLTANDIYKELGLRGYEYGGIFKGIESSDLLIKSGVLKWNNNWIAFIDTMLQFHIISQYTRDIFVPIQFQRVLIDPLSHLKSIRRNNICVHNHTDIRKIVAGGVEIQGIKWYRKEKYNSLQKKPKLEKFVFLPNDNNETKVDILNSQDALTASLQLSIENTNVLTLKIAEVVVGHQINALILPEIVKIINSEPQVRFNAILAIGDKFEQYKNMVKDFDIKVILKNAKFKVPENNCDLVVGTNILTHHDATNLLRNLSSALSQFGLIMIKESLKAEDNTFRLNYFANKANLMVVSRQMTERFEYILLRRRTNLPKNRIVIEITDDVECFWMCELSAAMKRNLNKDVRIYLVSYKRESGILGLFKCLQKEAGGQYLRAYFLPEASTPFNVQNPIFEKQIERDLAINVLYNGVWGTYRHLLLEDRPDNFEVKEAYLSILIQGDLTSLHWVESPVQFTNQSLYDNELCEVHYAALNNRDCMYTTSNMSSISQSICRNNNECALGIEFSGCTPEGRRVMGIVSSYGLATTVLTDKNFLWDVPENWSLEAAATVPVAYTTAYTALVIKGNIKHGESILIHDGNSSIGLAAMYLAFQAGCKVYITTDTKHVLRLLSLFLELKEDDIGSSCDSSFEQMILQRTSGRGVDLVMNSLLHSDDDKFLSSVRCVAEGGRFIELRHLDYYSNKTKCEVLQELLKRTFHSIKIDSLTDSEKVNVFNCVKDGIVNGVVHPLPTKVYSIQEIEDAFRYMATGYHVDKILIKMVSEKSEDSKFITKRISAVSRVYMHPKKSYILVGGLGGIGLELSQWLVCRGATKIVFNSRSKQRTGYQSWWFRRLHDQGIKLIVSTDDVTTIEGAKALLKQAMTLGDVGGIFNLAGVIREKLFQNLTTEDFQFVMKPKIGCTKSLDAASRQLALNLDHFVVFSSVFSGRGGHGQSSYGLANSAMERIVEQRRMDGLPGLAIQWGSIGDVGMVAEKKCRTSDDGVVIGTFPQPISSCLAVLDKLLPQINPVVACCMVASKHIIEKTCKEIDIKKTVAKVLGINDVSKMPQTATLVELGMDSLMAAEILTTLEKKNGILITIDELNRLTFDKIRKLEEETQNKQNC